MKLKHILFLTLLLTIVMVSAVSATDTNITQETLTSDADTDTLEIEAEDIIASNDCEDVIKKNYSESGNGTIILNGTKKDVSIEVYDTEAIEGEDSYVKAYFPDDATGEVTLSVGGMNYFSSIYAGKSLFNLSDLSAGSYNASVYYGGDENYDYGVAVFSLRVIGGNTFEALQILINREDSLTLDKDYEGSGTEISISRYISIDGNGHTLDAKGLSRIFNITASNCPISNLELVNGASGDNGGAIYVEGLCIITNCTFTNSSSNRSGGSIYSKGNSMIYNSNFINSTASYGGAIFINSSNSKISYSSFTDCRAELGGSVYVNGEDNRIGYSSFKNSTASKGGAIYFSSSGAVENCTFSNNNATFVVVNDEETVGGDGGAIFFGNDANVTDCSFYNNSAHSGAAILCYGLCNVTDCTFINNSGNYTGAMHFSDGNVTNCSFINNSASYGGAMHLDNGKITDCTFTGNSASFWGGALYIYADGNVFNCNFTNNSAINAGAIFTNANVTNSTFNDNKATSGSGGAIYFGFECELTNCNFTNNTATVDGGAIYFNGNVNITDCDFINNAASNCGGSINILGNNSFIADCTFDISNARNGGALYISGTNVSVSNSNFTSSNATADGGAIFINSSSCRISSSNFENCSAERGGSIYVSGDNNIIEKSMFKFSFATTGGAVYWAGNDGNISYSLFETCSADNGGAIMFNSTGGKIENSIFVNCSAQENGGAVYGNNATVIDCNFTANTAGCNGSAMYDCDYLGCTFEANTYPQIYLDEKLRKNMDIHVTLDVTYCFVGDNVTATIILGDNATGSVDVYLDDEVVGAVDIVNGTGLLTISADSPGNHTLRAFFSGDGEYLANESSVSFIVSKKTVSIQIDADDCFVGDNVTAVIRISDNFTGSVDVYLNNVSLGVVDIVNAGALTVTADSSGENIIKVVFSGDDMYLACENSTVFNAGKRTVDILIDASDAFVGDNVSVIITLTSNINGKVDVYLNNVSLGAVDIVNGEGVLNITVDSSGIYNVRVVFSGNDLYPASENSTEFTVGKKTINPIVTYDDKGFISVVLPDNLSKDVSFTIGNIFKNIAETADIDVRSLSAGNYTYSLDYEGDNYYNALSLSDNLRISKSLPSFEITASNIQYGENESVSIIIPDDLSDKVNYTLYKNEEILDNINLNESLFKNYTGLSIGSYIIKLQYVGDANYYQHQLNRTFTVLPKINMTQKLVITNFGNVYMDLGTATGSIQIFIDNEYYDGQRISAGKVNYTMPTDDLSLGNHEVTFKYMGNSFSEDIFTYLDEDTQQFLPIRYNLEILPIEIKAEVKSEEITYLTATIYDDLGEIAFDAKGSVEFFVNGEKYAVVDIVNGVAKLDVSNFKNGNYVIEWRYSGDNKYNTSSGNSTININYKITAKNLSKVYLSSNKYSVTVYGNGQVISGVKVTFLINNKVYKTVKTNKKGVASISISKVPGKYKITIKALSLKTTKTLKVTHVVSLKSVKVKKSANKLVLTATLKKVNGKYLKSKKVTFKFNGKKYTAKTNKKGVAKVTVKKSVLKKLKVGKKIKYQVTYKKDTVKKTVKVKK